jgi:3' terminal RNA ribose 2'-O-methyltransferase Hen1
MLWEYRTAQSAAGEPMLLTITTTHQPATDLGYLLAKNPARVQSFALSFGQAHVFYPEARPERCTAALVLDVDPVALVRGRHGAAGEGGALDHYVNDRPYAASSFLSVAIAEVFRTALGGRSKERPDLVGTALPLSARVAALPCRGGGEALVRALFSPLGYSVATEGSPLDSQFPAWGESPYRTLRLAATVRLQDLLSHLYVLVPVLDAAKHYWVGDDEVDKLLRHGDGWLAAHPARDLIVRRYLRDQRRLTRAALARLVEEEGADPDAEADEHASEEVRVEAPLSLHEQRLAAVMEALRAGGARRVLDLGCGEGRLLRLLLAEPRFTEIVGLDVAYRALEAARDRLRLDMLPPAQKDRMRLLHGSLTYRDRRLEGYDRRRGGGGDRAPRPAAPGRLHASGLRGRAARPGGRDHPQRRVQRALPHPACRTVAPPRSPLRVDARTVPGLGRRHGRALRLYRAFPAHRPTGRHVRCAVSDGGIYPWRVSRLAGAA